MPKIYYISGYQLAQARDFCRYAFGDFLHSVKLNQKNVCFDILLEKELNIKGNVKKIEEYVDIEYFKKHVGKQWKIKFIQND